MTEELQTLGDIVTRLETAGIDYMLTGSVALNLISAVIWTQGGQGKP